MKVLQIINCAYRATTEEQDDTIVWITHAMKGAGAELDVLLSGDAVNYSVAAQNSEGLSFGDWQQTQPPRLARDIEGLVGKGVDVYLVDEDVRDRGPLAVPKKLRNAPTGLMQKLGYGKEYKYPHNFSGNYVAEDYLPQELIGQRYYEPTDAGEESAIKAQLAERRKPTSE